MVDPTTANKKVEGQPAVAAAVAVAVAPSTWKSSSTTATAAGTTKSATANKRELPPPATTTTTNSVAAAAAAAGGGGGGGSHTHSRLLNTTACVPFVYGSVAFFLGKKADEFHTHKWTLYVRGANEEDLSGVIAKVMFHLHPSFAQPIRELTESPFEVTERGWGEFEAQIRIIWKDPQEKPTVINHGIKLYPVGSNMQPSKEPVVAEHYDEAVFTDPKEFFFQNILNVAHLPKCVFPDEAVRALFQTFSDEDDVQRLLEAKQFLTKELEAVKTRMTLVTEEMEHVDAALVEWQEAKKMAARNNSTTTTITAAGTHHHHTHTHHSKSNKGSGGGGGGGGTHHNAPSNTANASTTITPAPKKQKVG